MLYLVKYKKAEKNYVNLITDHKLAMSYQEEESYELKSLKNYQELIKEIDIYNFECKEDKKNILKIGRDAFRLIDCINNIIDEEFESTEVLENILIELIRKYFGTLSKIKNSNDNICLEIPDSKVNLIFNIKKEKNVYKINQYNINSGMLLFY